jgi:hypothetical protein
MIKAVFFDIDGTLLSHQYGEVPKSTKSALCQLKRKGIKLFAATGRHMTELEELPLCELPFDGYVTLNGQICLDSEKNLLSDSAIEPDDAQKMIAIFEKSEVPMMIVELNNMYINFLNPTVYAVQKAISTPVPDIGAYTGNRIYQFIIFDSRERVQMFTAQLSNCKMSEWNPYAFDIIPRNGGKVVGIKQMLRKFQIKQEEIMAFGDGENDVDMLRYANIGVAMGNADEIVKQQADYITAHIDQDGIQRALEFYGIL